MTKSSTAKAFPQLSGLDLTDTHLVIPSGMTFAKWEGIGQDLQKMEKGSAWWVGDWLVYGMDHFAEDDKYAQAYEETPYAHGTLRNMAWVARQYPPSTRNEVLTFTHYRALAGLEPEHRARWEQSAIENFWSAADLRKAIKAWRDSLEDSETSQDGQQDPTGDDDTPELSEAYQRTFQRLQDGMTPGVMKMLEGVCENFARTLDMPVPGMSNLILGTVVEHYLENDHD